jgi:membrane protease YdiL (CAAX protease family)
VNIDIKKSEEYSKKQARRGLVIFFTLLIVLSIPAYWLRIKGITPFTIIFTPAIASIITRLILKEGFRDVSFSFRGDNLCKAYLIAYLFPMAVALIAYGFTWISGLAEFDFSPVQSNANIPLPENPYLGFLVLIAIVWTAQVAVNMFFAAGEEIGWRGYMLTRLIDSGAPYPLLIHGLIWSAYHIPLILTGAYSPASGPSVGLTVVMFTIMATSFSYLLAWLRLDSGIIWPSFVAHATSNALTQSAFNSVTRGNNSMLWIGESGIVTAVVLLLLIFLVKRMYSHLKYAGY